jgi:hypothetical protein
MDQLGAVPIHLLLFAAMVLGYLFKDEMAQFLHVVSSFALMVLSLAAVTFFPIIPGVRNELLVTAYVVLLSSVVWAWFGLTRQKAYFGAGIVTSVVGCLRALVTFWHVLWLLPNPRAVIFVLAGTVSFLIGAAISAFKAGVRLPRRPVPPASITTAAAPDGPAAS